MSLPASLDALLASPAALIGVAVATLVVGVFLFNAIATRRPAGAPPVWSGLPLIGNFKKLGDNPLAAIREGYSKCGSVFTMQFLHYNMTFLIGTDAHTPFYRANDDELSQNEPYKFMTPIFGRGIVFDAPINIKNQQLKFVAGALKGKALDTYVPLIVKEVNEYLNEKWGNEGELDLMDSMASLTILTASRCLLGREIRENLFGEVSELLKEIDEGINPLAVFFPNAPIEAFRRRDAARAKLAKLFSKVIVGRRGLEEDQKPDDMLQAFIDAEYSDGSRCTDDQIVGMLLGVLFAGQHTSGITSTWTMLHLMHKPEYRRRAMEEMVTVFNTTSPDDVSVCTKANVQRLEFLHLCMKESLRMSPPLIMLMRAVHKPLQVGKYTVPVGDYVVASPAVSMNLPDASPDCVFKNPTTFDPDRYVAREGKPAEGERPFTFSAFGGGAHGCLGEQFGYLQVKTIVSMVMRRYELTPLHPMPPPNYKAMVVGPLQDEKGTIIRYKRRTSPLPMPGTASA